jgi:hypothetical protein
MTSSYIKSFDEEKKFRDRVRDTEKQDEVIDFETDPEYAAFKEEK